MKRTFLLIGPLAAAMAISSGAAAQTAGDRQPVLAGSYGWEDGVGTILHSVGNLVDPTNVGEDNGIAPNSGQRMLRVTEAPHAGTPQAHIAYIVGLQDGDVVRASFHGYDDSPAGSPSMRIWAHYAHSDNLTSPVPPAIPTSQQNETFTSGIGWEQISHEWTFNSNNGTRDSLVIEVRLFSTPATCEECSTDFYIDDVTVEVLCAANPDLKIMFPGGVVFDDPDEPSPDCDAAPPGPCDIEDLGTPDLAGAYGWEDGEATIFGSFTGGNNNLQAENVGPTDGIDPASGDRMLKLTEAPHIDTPQAWIGFIEGLQHGDIVHASFRAWDDTPGASPSVRIWAHYAVNSDPNSFAGSAGGNEEFSAGTGWDPLCHTWVFDAGTQSPPRNSLMIQARVFSTPATCEDCSTDFFIDDLEIAVFSNNPHVAIRFPDGTVIGDPADPTACTADVDGSGEIDLFDVFAVLGAWGTADPNADVNSDGIVDGADLGIVLASHGPCTEFLAPDSGSGQLILEDIPAAGELRQYDLFVQLDSTDALVNVFNADITSSLGFAGGSFVTIGPDFQDFDIAEDPNFNFTEFSSGTSLGLNAGWYNFDPSNNLGLAGQYPNNRVRIARFFVDPDTKFDAQVSVSYSDADGRAQQVTLDLEDVPDPPCPGDLTGSGTVGVPDLLALLSCWGAVAPGCEHADLTGSGTVGVPDLLQLLSNWGPCPQ